MKRTWYKIYRGICTYLKIQYPLRQKEIKIMKGENNTIHFVRRDSDEAKQQMKIIDLYFSFVEKYGHIFICDMNTKFDGMYSNQEYNIDFYTIISVLTLSGYDRVSIDLLYK